MSSFNEDFQAPPPPMPEAEPRAPRPVKFRPFAIGLFVAGILVLVGGIAKFITGGITTGGAMCFGGVLLFLLTLIPVPVVREPGEPLSFVEKLSGIFFEPARVFRDLRSYPQWIGAFAIIAVLSLVYSFAFVQRITPERIVEHMVDKVAEMPAPFTPPPQALEKMRTDQMSALKNPVERAGGMVKAIVGLFVLGALAAAICLVLVLVFGGRINFWQSLAVIFWAWLPVVIIQKVLGLVILYLKAPEDLHPIRNQDTTLQDNLSLLVSGTDHPVLFVLLSFIGLTWFYYLWLRAKGLHYGGTKVSSSAGWGVSIILYIMLMLFAVVTTSLFPSFVS
jgi:Yip1-like protein